MARRYLGYGTTNSQGIATLDHDPEGNTITGYTGVGAGLVDIIATSGSLQSETYALWDCLYQDMMTTSNHNDSIWKTNNATITRGSEYSIIKATAQWGTIYLGTTSAQQALPIDNGAVCIEYDAIDGISANCCFNIRWNDGTNHYYNCPTVVGHHKITLSKTKLISEVNDVIVQNWDINIPNAYFQSYSSEADTELQIANFKVYPI